MKIIHIISGGDVGGAKTHVLSLVSELSKEHEAVLVSFREGEFASDARALGINTVVINNKNPLKDFSDLKKLILSGKFDIVHCHGSKANVITSFIKKAINVPVITTVHSDYRIDYMGSLIKRLTFGVLNTVALRFFDGYIGVTNAFLDLLTERGFDPYKLYVLNNGIEFTDPEPKEERKEYLKKLGIECENPVVCGIAARFDPVKDIGCAISAVAKVCRECKNLYLVLGGDGDEADNLRELVKKNGIEERVIFAGWIKDMDSFLNAVDISIVSSLSEGFPYSVLESIRSRCTMISTKVGAMPEIINDGIDGLLFDIGDSDTLARHIKLLYEDEKLRRGMAERLLKKAKVRYSFENMVKTQVAIYETAILKKEQAAERRRVLLCGSYGRGNAGDDAILKAVIREINEVSENAEICVMSKNPLQTKLRYRVRSVHTFNLFKVISQMRKSYLYINGGGSLIQDSTSSRSLYFYLFTLWLAKVSRCKVMMYGCGIGPVTKKKNRLLAGHVIDKNVDCITLRDPDSYEDLKAMDVRRPRMFLAADPTLGIAPAPEYEIEKVFKNEGLDINKKYLCLAIRKWKNIDDKLPHIVSAAKYAEEKYGLSIALISMERSRDIEISEKIKKELPDAVVIRGEYDVHTVIGILSKMHIIMAMRLHALVFGAGQGVATIGIAYDHKVTGFMNYIGREMCVLYKDCEAEILKNFIDRTMSDMEYGEHMKQACREMRENEKENTNRLREFF